MGAAVMGAGIMEIHALSSPNFPGWEIYISYNSGCFFDFYYRMCRMSRTCNIKVPKLQMIALNLLSWKTLFFVNAMNCMCVASLRCWFGSTLFVKPFTDKECADGVCAITHRLGFNLYTCLASNVTHLCNESDTECCDTFMCNSDENTGVWTGDWPSDAGQVATIRKMTLMTTVFVVVLITFKDRLLDRECLWE